MDDDGGCLFVPSPLHLIAAILRSRRQRGRDETTINQRQWPERKLCYRLCGGGGRRRRTTQVNGAREGRDGIDRIALHLQLMRLAVAANGEQLLQYYKHSF